MLATHKGEIPFLILIVPFLLGLTLGCCLPSDNYNTSLLFAFSVTAASFIALNIFYNRLKLYKKQWLGGILIHALLIVTGWLCYSRYNETYAPDHFAKKHAQFILATINNEPVFKGSYLRFTADVRAIVEKQKTSTASGIIMIALKDSSAKDLYYGDQILIPANYKPVEPPYNPGEFNYKQYLANQNIHYQALIFSKQYKIVSRNCGNPIIAYSLKLRQRLVAKFKADMHDAGAIAVASTLILGYKADLSNDILQAYSKTGTIHVLSVSGAHVAILFAVLNLLLGFLRRFRYGDIVKATLIICSIWYYSLLTGFSPAVCRAAVMITMVIVGKTFSRYINTLNILSLSAFLLLLYDPYFISDVGFQLSYLAVFGLIVFQPIIYNTLAVKNKWMDKLWALCTVSIAAQLITFPLSAYYFHQFPLYFLVSNLVIILPSAIIMYAGIAFLLLPQLSFVSNSLALILEKYILWMNRILTVIEHAPYSSITKIWINPSEYFVLYVVIFSLFLFLSVQKKWLLHLSVLGLLIFCVMVGIDRIGAYRTHQIAFLNLRKNTGIVFKNGSEATIITNLTDTDKAFKYSVQPFLDSSKIDHVHMITLDQDLTNNFFCKKRNVVQFNDKRLIIYDLALSGLTFSQKVKTNWLFISGNRSVNVKDITLNYDFDILINGGNFNNVLTDTLIKGANVKPNFYKILRRNNCIMLASN